MGHCPKGDKSPLFSSHIDNNCVCRTAHPSFHRAASGRGGGGGGDTLRMYKQTCRHMDQLMDRLMDGRTDGMMGGLTH
jgi:hypothetical protein